MPFQDGYALLIGIGSYSYHHDLDLPETVHDVQAFSESCRTLPYAVTCPPG